MKNLKTFAVVLGSVFIGATFSSFAMSASSYSPAKIAVVDVPAVVASSGEVNKLKDTQKGKIEELTDFIKKAKADIDSTKDANQKKKLENGYNKELKERKNKIDKDYITTLSGIEKSISAVIAKKAKEDNYQIVLSKGIVLYGGDDITSDIKKIVK
jgi:Skp family chaperone for outer membrane proteins